MRPYSKLSWKELQARINSSPPDTPDYIKAKEERDNRVRRIGLWLMAGGILVAAAIKLFSN